MAWLEMGQGLPLLGSRLVVVFRIGSIGAWVPV